MWYMGRNNVTQTSLLHFFNSFCLLPNYPLVFQHLLLSYYLFRLVVPLRRETRGKSWQDPGRICQLWCSKVVEQDFGRSLSPDQSYSLTMPPFLTLHSILPFSTSLSLIHSLSLSLFLFPNPSFAGKPKLLVRPRSIVNPHPDEDFRIDCEATGRPTPSITWLINTKPIKFDRPLEGITQQRYPANQGAPIFVFEAVQWFRGWPGGCFCLSCDQYCNRRRSNAGAGCFLRNVSFCSMFGRERSWWGLVIDNCLSSWWVVFQHKDKIWREMKVISISPNPLLPFPLNFCLNWIIFGRIRQQDACLILVRNFLRWLKTVLRLVYQIHEEGVEASEVSMVIFFWSQGRGMSFAETVTHGTHRYGTLIKKIRPQCIYSIAEKEGAMAKNVFSLLLLPVESPFVLALLLFRFAEDSPSSGERHCPRWWTISIRLSSYWPADCLQLDLVSPRTVGSKTDCHNEKRLSGNLAVSAGKQRLANCKRFFFSCKLSIFCFCGWLVRWCILLTRLTLVCEVIWYRLVQVRQNLKKKMTFRFGGPQSLFSISSSFILSFVLLPFFLKTKIKHRCSDKGKCLTLRKTHPMDFILPELLFSVAPKTQLRAMQPSLVYYSFVAPPDCKRANV